MSSSSSGTNKKTKRERREAMARKRDERAVRAAHRKERKAQAYLADDMNFASFANQLASMGLKLRDIPGDGNCLFRALGDQLDGHGKYHLKHREDVVKYMQEHRQDFEPFVEDDIPFERYIANLRKPGTYAGNDAIVAFARLRGLTVVIHQMNSPLWQIQGSDDKNAKQLHISYHNGDHYSSVRKLSDASQNPTSIKLKADGTPFEGSNSEGKGKYKHKSPGNSYNQNGFSGASQYSVYHESETDAYSWQCNEEEVSEYTAPSVGRGHNTYTTGDVDGAHVARAIRDEDSIVEQISHETGCTDLIFIKETLEENFMDIGSTVAYVAQVMATQDDVTEPMSASQDSGIWSPEGTATRIFGENGTGTKPKQKLSSAKTKRNKKLEKKQRAMERHKLYVLGKAGLDSGYNENNRESSDEDAVIVKSLKTLNI